MSAESWWSPVLGERVGEKIRILSSYRCDMPPDLPSDQDAKTEGANRKGVSLLSVSIVYRVHFQFLQISSYFGIRAQVERS